MNLTYGFVKCKIVSDPVLQSKRLRHEIQYHLHASLKVTVSDGSAQQWDSAINVGTNDSDDLLQYKLIFDFQHSMIAKRKSADSGFTDLTGYTTLPALDFLRSDLLSGTGNWRPSDIMDGSKQVEPVASLLRLLLKARDGNNDVYVFGRKYVDGLGIHDVHMNQGSGGSFLNNGEDNHNDHNDIWQEGAVLVDLGQPEFAAYFTAFTQQNVLTDGLGNPQPTSHPISVSDDGSESGG